MANPVELIRAAEKQRERRGKRTSPAHCNPETGGPPVQALRRPHAGHSAYSALMRSHDRVKPRIGR